MEQTNSLRESSGPGAAVAAIASIVWVAGSTIVGELDAPFKNWLKAVFTHHWIGKGIIAVAIFVFIFVIMTVFARKFARARSMQILQLLVWTSILSLFAIVGFYLYKDFFA